MNKNTTHLNIGQHLVTNNQLLVKPKTPLNNKRIWLNIGRFKRKANIFWILKTNNQHTIYTPFVVASQTFYLGQHAEQWLNTIDNLQFSDKTLSYAIFARNGEKYNLRNNIMIYYGMHESATFMQGAEFSIIEIPPKWKASRRGIKGLSSLHGWIPVRTDHPIIPELKVPLEYDRFLYLTQSSFEFRNQLRNLSIWESVNDFPDHLKAIMLDNFNWLTYVHDSTRYAFLKYEHWKLTYKQLSSVLFQLYHRGLVLELNELEIQQLLWGAINYLCDSRNFYLSESEKSFLIKTVSYEYIDFRNCTDGIWLQVKENILEKKSWFSPIKSLADQINGFLSNMVLMDRFDHLLFEGKYDIAFSVRAIKASFEELGHEIRLDRDKVPCVSFEFNNKAATKFFENRTCLNIESNLNRIKDYKD